MIQWLEERVKTLNDERVRMVERHEKPCVIQAVSDAYLREHERLETLRKRQ